jgi:hypothetical protein
MKKLMASLLVVIFGATMVMAEVQTPVSIQAAPILSGVADVQAQTADFADVEGVTLNELEAEGVKGEGVVGAITGAFGGAVGAAITESVRTAYLMVTKQEKRTGKQIANDIKVAVKWSAATAAVWGAIVGP